MNKTISIIRIAILFSLGMVAFLLIFGEEQDADLLFMDFPLCHRQNYWHRHRLSHRPALQALEQDRPWFIAYDKMCDEVMDKPNPTQL